ncbi:signal peptidase II [Microaerobacter geothermalis]|uniref:signal peptidase II n=1 Tax=Microaerobacter geothermalis TaxID=674972 RepID=UPI001F276A07|nr:signal peptidase II [Microaerobacter geothermalis]MCF6094758.1 signal peptidase II [Microaerobacter geothermalis]
MGYYILALIVFLLDQLSKLAVVKWMTLYESIPIIDGFFYLTSSRNRGAAFGILQNQRWLFIVITLIVIGAIIYYLQHSYREKRISIALSLILGGAVGNFVDRLVTGEVVDFLDFRFFSYNYPIFNLADSFIVIGAGLFILDMFLQSRRKAVN